MLRPRTLSCLLLPGLFLAHALAEELDMEKAAKKREAAQREVYSKMTAADEAGFTRLGDPKQGGWMSLVAEAPQTLADYKESKPVHATPDRPYIVLQPLWSLDAPQQEALQAMKEYVAACFQLPARIEAPISFDARDRKLSLTRVITVDRFNKRTEYDGEKLLDLLVKRVPEDAAVYFAVTDVDVYVGTDNLHGYASLGQRAGLMTFNRLWPKNAKNLNAETLRRCVRFASHEIGHMFGIEHCVFYRCPMNGCKNLAESDTSPLHFCPVCQQKIQWLLEPDMQKRNAALLAFYEKYGLKEEAAWTKKRMNGTADERR
jgi:archaemetzincin